MYRSLMSLIKTKKKKTNKNKTKVGVLYLRLSVKRSDAGTTVNIPDTYVTITGATSRCQDVGLPWTPG